MNPRYDEPILICLVLLQPWFLFSQLGSGSSTMVVLQLLVLLQLLVVLLQLLVYKFYTNLIYLINRTFITRFLPGLQQILYFLSVIFSTSPFTVVPSFNLKLTIEPILISSSIELLLQKILFLQSNSCKRPSSSKKLSESF